MQQAVSPNPAPCATLKRVLIVEDDDSVARIYRRVLENPDYHLTQASNGAEALSLFDKTPFDAIVSDLVMPGMSGVELLKSVRERDREVPFVIVTGRPAVESAITAVECGALRYLLKPVPPHVLRDTVAHAVGASDRNRVARRPLPRTPESLLGESSFFRTEADFREALESLYMIYQPIVRPSRGGVIGYEALVRTGNPRLSQPPELLEAARRVGGFGEFGRRVRRAVAADLVKFPTDALLFVNLHTRELLDEALYSETNPLRKHAGRIVLELTARGYLDNVQSRVEALRKRGFLIALDDVNAGYAGLSRLVGLDPDFVKVDPELVRGIDTDGSKRTLVASLLSACRDLEIELVCEGVETESEARQLSEIGVDLLQGYFFAWPQRSFPRGERKRLELSLEELASLSKPTWRRGRDSQHH
jgi:EAL domain-containing protein (putative c-di-GMP-specific phosphodiesterase class I)/CheY-like chemotaxis protein